MHFSSLLVRVNIEAEFSILFILANKIDDYLRHVHNVQCLQITNPCEYLVKRLQIDPISYGSVSAGQEKWPFNVIFF